jgi:hypothetical protein
MIEDIAPMWETAARWDATLRVRPADLAALRRKRVAAEPYSRQRLFTCMAAGKASVFSDFPVPVDARPGESRGDAVLRWIRTGFPRRQLARVQTGRSRTRGEIPVGELVRRFSGGRAVISVTDLHIRDTRLERALGVEGLSDFNLLIRGSERMAIQEMMTLVVSSKGNVTDSHTDDPDGSNHCFTGCKLWLFWETFEGKAKGLQDVSRDEVEERADFDMKTFLALPSARWLTVSTGETLFLPGKMTHKVVTLEPYLGVGSFYVALPSCLETLIRWNTRGPLWSLDDPDGDNDGLVDEIARSVARKVRALHRASPRAQEHWGLGYLEAAVERWERSERRGAKERLLGNAAFAELVESVSSRLATRAA